jgi:4-hydroxybenzoate polyprenyltransferase
MFRQLPMFLRAVFAEWGSGVTGAASAPLFLAGLFAPQGTLKIVAEVFAFLCFLYSSFAVWSREHEKNEPSGPNASKPSLLLTYEV